MTTIGVFACDHDIVVFISYNDTTPMELRCLFCSFNLTDADLQKDPNYEYNIDENVYHRVQ